MNIEIISGSPRRGSISARVALHLFGELQDRTVDHRIGLIDMREHSLPQIQTVWSSTEAAPPEHREMAERVFAANAFILVSPEYNGGYAPVMKNFLDHFPKQTRKAFGIATSSVGAMGGIRASQQMLQLVPALFGIASPTLLIAGNADKKFGEDGSLLDEAFGHQVNNFLTDFLWLAERIAG